MLTTSPLKDQIALRAGLDADALTGIGPSLGVDGGVPRSTPAPATSVRADFDDALPIITVSARAPGRTTARTLAAASVAVLREYVHRLAVLDRVPRSRELVVTALGTTSMTQADTGSRHVALLALTGLVLGLGCAALLGAARRRLRG